MRCPSLSNDEPIFNTFAFNLGSGFVLFLVDAAAGVCVATAAAATERVALAEKQIELLGRLDTLQEQSADDLRELDRLLARLLREARDAGDDKAVRQLQRSADSVVSAFKRLETGAVRVFQNAEPIRNFAKELVQLQNAAENTQGFENQIRAARELGRVQLEQIDTEIRNVARPFIERQQLSEEERQRVIADLTTEPATLYLLRWDPVIKTASGVFSVTLVGSGYGVAPRELYFDG